MAKIRDAGLTAALQVLPLSKLARAAGVRPQSLIKWPRIPPKRVFAIEAATGIPREVLRPDIYAVPRPRRVRQSAHV